MRSDEQLGFGTLALSQLSGPIIGYPCITISPILVDTIWILKNIYSFIYLKERETEGEQEGKRERERDSTFYLLLTSQVATTARAGPDQSQEPETPSVSLMSKHSASSPVLEGYQQETGWKTENPGLNSALCYEMLALQAVF